jgi:hypothetical protein
VWRNVIKLIGITLKLKYLEMWYIVVLLNWLECGRILKFEILFDESLILISTISRSSAIYMKEWFLRMSN